MSAYCLVTDVTPFAAVWTDNGAFTVSTRPTLAQVEGWITQVSALLDTALAEQGFSVPIVAEKALPMMKLFVASLVADMCHATNSSGRFFTEKAIERGINWFGQISKDIQDWAVSNSAGLEKLGAIRDASPQGSGIGFMEFDSQGTKTYPIFQRDSFGNSFRDGRME